MACGCCLSLAEAVYVPTVRLLQQDLFQAMTSESSRDVRLPSA